MGCVCNGIVRGREEDLLAPLLLKVRSMDQQH